MEGVCSRADVVRGAPLSFLPFNGRLESYVMLFEGCGEKQLAQARRYVHPPALSPLCEAFLLLRSFDLLRCHVWFSLPDPGLPRLRDSRTRTHTHTCTQTQTHTCTQLHTRRT